MTLRYYNRKGEPIELLEWARLFEDFEYKRIGYDELPNGIRVSTVWIGHDPYDGMFDRRPPLIFGTMIFGGPRDREEQQYATEEDAFIGHSATVAIEALRKPTSS